MKGLVIGLLLGMLLAGGGVFFYFSSGMAPAAVADAPMPMEKKMAKLALAAHIKKDTTGQPPIAADEPNFIAGALVYKQQCGMCHGLPAERSPYATAMYPPPPRLFPGKGVSDDPASETYWKVVNGIRLTGMPSFKDTLSDTQSWQVSQLLAHSNELPPSVTKLLVPDAPATQTAKP